MQFYSRKGVNGAKITIATWNLGEKPYAEPTDPGNPNNYALNNNWRNIADFINSLEENAQVSRQDRIYPLISKRDSVYEFTTSSTNWENINELFGAQRLWFKNIGFNETIESIKILGMARTKVAGGNGSDGFSGLNQNEFSGTLSHIPVHPNSVNIEAYWMPDPNNPNDPGYTNGHDDGNGNIVPSGGGNQIFGTINYLTGEYYISIPYPISGNISGTITYNYGSISSRLYFKANGIQDLYSTEYTRTQSEYEDSSSENTKYLINLDANAINSIKNGDIRAFFQLKVSDSNLTGYIEIGDIYMLVRTKNSI